MFDWQPQQYMAYQDHGMTVFVGWRGVGTRPALLDG